MPKGDGSIVEVKDKNGKSYTPKKWRVCVSFGNDPITGERLKAQRIVNGTKLDARALRDQLKRDHESGLRLDADKETFADFSAVWLEARRVSGEVGLSRLDKEKRMLDLLCSYIADMAIPDITPQVIEKLYAAIKADKVAKRGAYSGTTLKMIHQLLKQILGKALDYGYILRNPCDRVKAPKADEPERRSLTAEQGAVLLSKLNSAETEAYEAMQAKEQRQLERGNLFDRTYLRGLNLVSNIVAVRIGLATGMRRGEVFGLSWGCVNLESGVIRVEQSLTEYGELKPPKSKAGIRSIHIDRETVRHLSTWKSRQAAELRKLYVKQDAASPVCCSEVGGRIDLHNFERWWRRFRKELGFEGLKFHELRHTQATQLLANGVDVKTVQTRMGHANAAITLNWYAHAIPENDEKAAQLVGKLFETEPKTARIIELKTA